MKYLIITNNSGGLYCIRKELMERLIRDGNELYVVTPFDEFVDELRALGGHLIEQDLNRRGMNPFQEIQLLWAYRNIIKRVSPDRIITYTIKPGIYGGLLARRMKIPYIVNVTGLGTAFQRAGLLRMLVVRLWKTALQSAESVFFENQGNAQVFLDYDIVPADKIHVLPGAGVNLDDFPYAMYPPEGELVRFLFIGRLMREKGIEELLCAMEQLYQKCPNIRLDIVGRYEEDYESELQEIQAHGFVKFHGYQRDVRPYIRQAHILVLPSYHEGMANALLEAAAMGRPLITSKVSGCMEAVRDGETGFLCESQDVHSLTEKMERFIHLPYEQKKQMGLRSHEFVAERFDRKKVVQETVRLMER